MYQNYFLIYLRGKETEEGTELLSAGSSSRRLWQLGKGKAKAGSWEHLSLFDAWNPVAWANKHLQENKVKS